MVARRQPLRQRPAPLAPAQGVDNVRWEMGEAVTLRWHGQSQQLQVQAIRGKSPHFRGGDSVRSRAEACLGTRRACPRRACSAHSSGSSERAWMRRRRGLPARSAHRPPGIGVPRGRRNLSRGATLAGPSSSSSSQRASRQMLAPCRIIAWRWNSSRGRPETSSPCSLS